jgi:hypothetical protein
MTWFDGGGVGVLFPSLHSLKHVYVEDVHRISSAGV